MRPAMKGGRRGAGTGDGYHHGDLRSALVAATEAILAERGVAGFTLREAARRAGVSPAAPAHHFGSAAGLLTEVAILGFEALGKELQAGNRRGGDDPVLRLREQGVGYVRFALRHPARFLLMFRRDLLLPGEARLQAAAGAAFGALARGVRDVLGDTPAAATPDLLLLAWSSVHGFAHLALEGQLDLLRGAVPLDDFIAGALPPMLARAIARPAGGRDSAP